VFEKADGSRCHMHGDGCFGIHLMVRSTDLGKTSKPQCYFSFDDSVSVVNFITFLLLFPFQFYIF
jgi:hypothetical protein